MANSTLSGKTHFSAKIKRDITRGKAINLISKIYKDLELYNKLNKVHKIVDNWKRENPNLKYSDLVKLVRKKYTLPLSKEAAARAQTPPATPPSESKAAAPTPADPQTDPDMSLEEIERILDEKNNDPNDPDSELKGLLKNPDEAEAAARAEAEQKRLAEEAEAAAEARRLSEWQEGEAEIAVIAEEARVEEQKMKAAEEWENIYTLHTKAVFRIDPMIICFF